MEVLHPFVGSKGEQHIYQQQQQQKQQAASTSSKQAVKQSLQPRRGSKPASKWFKTTGEQRRIATSKFHAVSSCLARSMAYLVSNNGRYWAVIAGMSSGRLQ